MKEVNFVEKHSLQPINFFLIGICNSREGKNQGFFMSREGKNQVEKNSEGFPMKKGYNWKENPSSFVADCLFVFKSPVEAWILGALGISKRHYWQVPLEICYQAQQLLEKGDNAEVWGEWREGGIQVKVGMLMTHTYENS